MQYLIKFWCFWLLPPKFYGGGGGNDIVEKRDPQAEALARIGNEKWDVYQKTYVPLENQWIKNSQGLNDKTYHNTATGQAATEIKTKSPQQTADFGASMQGQHTGTGNYLSQANDIAQAQGTANTGVTGRYLSGEQGIIDVGNGQSTQAIQGLTDVANQSVTGQIQRARNIEASQNANLGAMGTVAGGMTAAATHYLTKK